MNAPALPAPPAHYEVALPIREFAPGADWFRVHAATHEPVYFNRTSSHRFNAPAGEYGVLYVSVEPRGAFAESFFRAPSTIPPMVTRKQLSECGLSLLRWAEPLRLVDLSGPGLVALGLDKRLATGASYVPSQAWSRWFWAHPTAAAGLLYRSRHDPSELCAALFSERVSVAPEVVRLTASLEHPRFAAALSELLTHYRAALL